MATRPKPGELRQTGDFQRCMAAHGFQNRCLLICDPRQGVGLCGRLAPHAMRSKTQDAIARYAQQAR